SRAILILIRKRCCARPTRNSSAALPRSSERSRRAARGPASRRSPRWMRYGTRPRRQRSSSPPVRLRPISNHHCRMSEDHDLRSWSSCHVTCRCKRLLALELGLSVTRLHCDLDTAAIVTALEKMGAHGLCLELRALLLTALPELLPTLSAANLVVGVTVSSALRK